MSLETPISEKMCEFPCVMQEFTVVHFMQFMQVCSWGSCQRAFQPRSPPSPVLRKLQDPMWIAVVSETPRVRAQAGWPVWHNAEGVATTSIQPKSLPSLVPPVSFPVGMTRGALAVEVSAGVVVAVGVRGLPFHIPYVFVYIYISV